MDNKNQKTYFDIIFSITTVVFTSLLVIGQIVFLCFGLGGYIFGWGKDEILILGIGAFSPIICLCLILLLFFCWKYWLYDDEGVTNGNLFFKRKILYSNIDLIEIKTIAIGAKPFIAAQKNICFYQGKKVVTIPIFCLSENEIEWLKKQANKKQEKS